MTNRPSRQRGAAALAVTLVLLCLMALTELYVCRSLVFEQRASANQYRAAQAFEAAEAGLGWATALLNDPGGIDANCLPAPGTASFRNRYAPDDAGHALRPVSTLHPLCRLDDDRLACRCPKTLDDSVHLEGSGGHASFSVAFEPMPGDGDSVKLTATGCQPTAAPCLPGSEAAADAVARVSVIVKLDPLLRRLPAAALTASGDVTIDAAALLRNLTPAAGGLLVEAGGDIALDVDARLSTIPGSPIANALLRSETALAGTGGEPSRAAFDVFFGMSSADYRASPRVQPVAGATAATRGQALLAAYAQGQRAFYSDGALEIDAASIGTDTDPLLIVGSGGVTCPQACVLHGLLFDEMASPPGAATDVHGAVIAAGSHRRRAGSRIDYDLDVLQVLRRRTSALVPVPGSWHDV